MEDGIVPDADPGGKRPRSPYQRPAIAWEEEADMRSTLIAACGKVQVSEADCLATGPAS